jgi:MFS family permease
MNGVVSWRRNLVAVTAAVFIGFTGFTLVMPFLPLYFRHLGVEEVGAIAFWSGVSLGVTPAVTALLAPFWGRLADRFGRKIMVERSLASFVVVMAALAYVTRPWHVFALRLVQGFFAGYGALALTMAADSAPPGRLASAIGMVQTAQRLGPALGPVIGGAIAQVVGLRRAFLVSAGFYLFGLVLVFVFYREPPLPAGDPHTAPAGPPPETTPDGAVPARSQAGGRGPRGEPAGPVTFRDLRALEHFLLMMGAIFGLQFVDRSFGPILPLQLAAFGVPDARVPVVSGILFSLAAGFGALGNTACGPLLARFSARAIIGGASVLAAAAALAFVVAPSVGWLYPAAVVFGLAIGSAMTAAYTVAGSVLPAAARGAGFGFLTTASLTGLAVSPMVAGLLGQASISAVFVLDAVGLALIGAMVSRVMVDHAAPSPPPAVEDV